MNLADQKDFAEAPPEGGHEFSIVETEPTTSKASGATMIKFTGEILTPGFEGFQFHDNIITEGGAPGAGFGKRKLRGLIGDVVDSPQGLPDQEICDKLLGARLFGDFIHEQIMDETEKGSGTYDKPRFDIDPKTGKRIAVNKLIAQRYYAHNPRGAKTATAPAAGAQTAHGGKMGIKDAAAETAPAAATPNGAPAPTGAAPPPWAQGGAQTGARRTVKRSE